MGWEKWAEIKPESSAGGAEFASRANLLQAGAPLVGFLHRSRLSCIAEVLVSLWSKRLSTQPSPEFLYPFPPNGMHPALFFLSPQSKPQ